MNLFDLRWVAFDGITFTDRFDLFHCERCQHVLLTRSRLAGSPSELHENVKINQSQHIGITDSVISGADDNAIDFVAVQYARITGNVIERANDWCAYAKGGSAFVTVARNRIRDCGTGGFTAGQGTGLQFMTAPFIRYEAYDIDVLDNLISDIEGAGIGVNGGYNVVVARNRMWDVGIALALDRGRLRLALVRRPARRRGPRALRAEPRRRRLGNDARRRRHQLRPHPQPARVGPRQRDRQPAGQGDQLFSIAAPFGGRRTARASATCAPTTGSRSPAT